MASFLAVTFLTIGGLIVLVLLGSVTLMCATDAYAQWKRSGY